MIRDEDAWLRVPIERYVAALLSDKPNPTAGEASMIEVAGLARGCCLLIMSELRKTGFTHLVKGAVELSPAAIELNSFMCTEVKALKAVGLGRRARPVASLADYLESRSQAPEETHEAAQETEATSSGAPQEPSKQTEEEGKSAGGDVEQTTPRDLPIPKDDDL